MINELKRNKILRYQRKYLGLTQLEVANKSNIYVTQYRRFETGERDIMNASFYIVVRIINVLELNLDNFYYGKYLIENEKLIAKKT